MPEAQVDKSLPASDSPPPPPFPSRAHRNPVENSRAQPIHSLERMVNQTSGARDGLSEFDLFREDIVMASDDPSRLCWCPVGSMPSPTRTCCFGQRNNNRLLV